jgi:hypothetical protein
MGNWIVGIFPKGAQTRDDHASASMNVELQVCESRRGDSTDCIAWIPAYVVEVSDSHARQACKHAFSTRFYLKHHETRSEAEFYGAT